MPRKLTEAQRREAWLATLTDDELLAIHSWIHRAMELRHGAGRARPQRGQSR